MSGRATGPALPDPDIPRTATGRLLMRSPWLLASAGTALFLAAFPPFGVWPLAGLGPVLLAAAMLTARSRARAFGRGFVVGVVLFGLGNLWIADSSPVNLAAVALVQGFWFGVFGLVARAALPGRAPWPALPVVWVAIEFARHHLPMSGYPWDLAGMAWAADRHAVQVADVGGVHLVSFVAVSLGAALWTLGDGRRARALGALAFVLVAYGYGVVRLATFEPGEPGPLVGTIQPNIRQELKEGGMAPRERLEVCLRQSRQLLAEHPDLDLLVWPETMVPFPVGDGVPDDRWFEGVAYGPAEAAAQERELLDLLAGELPADGPPPWVLLGALHHEGDVSERLVRRNVALLYDPTGERVDLYAKHVLVPGGEYIPYADALPGALRGLVSDAIDSLAGFVATLSPGPGADVMTWDRGPPFGVTICYENAYGDHFRDAVELGARFHVVLSNEAWFRESTEFDHMELHSVLRAVETRRAVFRSTNSGISCLVAPDGRVEKLVVDGRDRAVGGTFARRVPLRDDVTGYTTWGDAAAWICLAVALVFSRGGTRIAPLS